MVKCQSINYLVFFFKAVIDLRKTKKMSSFERKQYIIAIFGKPTHLLVMGGNHKDAFILTIKPQIQDNDYLGCVCVLQGPGDQGGGGR